MVGRFVILMSQIFSTCDERGHAIVRKGIHNLVDWQKPDGALFSPIPAGSWDMELPLQMLASIGNYGFWNYYMHTGDKATIDHAYPAVQRYLALWRLGPDGLVVHRGGGWDWADWGENIYNAVIDNPWLHQALGAAINMARLSGNEADSPGYEARRARIRRQQRNSMPGKACPKRVGNGQVTLTLATRIILPIEKLYGNTMPALLMARKIITS